MFNRQGELLSIADEFKEALAALTETLAVEGVSKSTVSTLAAHRAFEDPTEGILPESVQQVKAMASGLYS